MKGSCAWIRRLIRDNCWLWQSEMSHCKSQISWSHSPSEQLLPWDPRGVAPTGCWWADLQLWIPPTYDTQDIAVHSWHWWSPQGSDGRRCADKEGPYWCDPVDLGKLSILTIHSRLFRPFCSPHHGCKCKRRFITNWLETTWSKAKMDCKNFSAPVYWPAPQSQGAKQFQWILIDK